MAVKLNSIFHLYWIKSASNFECLYNTYLPLIEVLKYVLFDLLHYNKLVAKDLKIKVLLNVNFGQVNTDGYYF